MVTVEITKDLTRLKWDMMFCSNRIIQVSSSLFNKPDPFTNTFPLIQQTLQI